MGPDYAYKDSSTGWEEELDPSVRDLRGHGTHVAGILAAETNNDSGIAGVAGGCKILVIQIGSSVSGYITYGALKKGIYAAVDSGARIIRSLCKTS